jgi:hypothetical protein
MQGAASLARACDSAGRPRAQTHSTTRSTTASPAMPMHCTWTASPAAPLPLVSMPGMPCFAAADGPTAQLHSSKEACSNAMACRHAAAGCRPAGILVPEQTRPANTAHCLATPASALGCWVPRLILQLQGATAAPHLTGQHTAHMHTHLSNTGDVSQHLPARNPG